VRIAIIAHNALGALTGVSLQFGGVERQVSLMAKWLAARGHAVSVLVWDEGQGPTLRIDDVDVIAVSKREAGLPGLRFFPRWWSLAGAMGHAAADIYYQNGAEYVTGQAALWCRRHRRVMVFSTASDLDCHELPGHLTSWRERVLYRYGVRAATEVVVQTEMQRQSLQRHFGRSSTVLPMGALDPFAGDGQVPARARSDRFRVCWVGRVSTEKRLEKLLDVAEVLPDVDFDVVGGPDGLSDYVRWLMQRAERMPNVVWHGRLSPDRVQHIYAKAQVLCCTSMYEGFPNTFLEAWAQGLPVVSTIDPDGVLTRHQVGFHATTVQEVAQRLILLRHDIQQQRTLSARCRAYFLREFESNAAFGRFEALFESALSRSAARVER
jgi:glycosyltransferase involved in cell wall biosynthesis